ncbi:hypothetical protein DSM07_08035 [Oenococcus sp. UCMA 16435]|nr:hypothetical protein DSM07_08035 [Oenococcus sp. UCMA 16435]MDI4585181.1 hypothetical protein [Oenococcus sp. UCMA 14587]
MGIASYEMELTNKYESVIRNKWFWIIVVLMIVIGYFSYAYYCTSRGYNFQGGIKFHSPKSWEMMIGCKR